MSWNNCTFNSWSQVSVGDEASWAPRSHCNQTLGPRSQLCQGLPHPTCHPIRATMAHPCFQRFAANIAGMQLASNQLEWYCSMGVLPLEGASVVLGAAGSPEKLFSCSCHRIVVAKVESFLPRWRSCGRRDRSFAFDPVQLECIQYIDTNPFFQARVEYEGQCCKELRSRCSILQCCQAITGYAGLLHLSHASLWCHTPS